MDARYRMMNKNNLHGPLPEHLDGVLYRSTRPCHGQHPDQAKFQISQLEFRVPKMDEEEPEPPHRPLSHANLIQPSQQRRRQEKSLSDSERPRVWCFPNRLNVSCMNISLDHGKMTSCTGEMMETKAIGRVQALSRSANNEAAG
jgi:hypothetical protein